MINQGKCGLQDLVHFPSVTALGAEEESGHRFICTSHLFLHGSYFSTFAFEALELSVLHLHVFDIEVTLKPTSGQEYYSQGGNTHAFMDHFFPSSIFLFVSSSARSLASDLAKVCTEISPRTMLTFRFGFPLSLRMRILSLTFLR